MNSPLALSIDRDLPFVLCAFGRSGLAYVESITQWKRPRT
jgi:hypothetical protein